MQLNATDAVTAIADLIEAGYIHDFRIRDGQIVDVFPYERSHFLHAGETGLATQT